MIYIACLLIGWGLGAGCAVAYLKKTNTKGVVQAVKTEVRDAAGNIVK